MTDLERFHSEVRVALITARREIRRLNFGRRDNPVLNKLREVMRDAGRGGDGAGTAKGPIPRSDVGWQVRRSVNYSLCSSMLRPIRHVQRGTKCFL